MTTSSSSESDDSRRYVALMESQIEAYIVGRTQGYKVRLEVSEAHGIVSEIFVFQRRPNPVAGGSPVDEFANVASPSDLDNYAVGEPLPTQSHYRLSRVDLVFRNFELLEQTIGDIETDISELIRTLNQLDSLVDQSHVLTGVTT